MVPLTLARSALAGLLAALLAACASAPPAEQDRFFRLEPPAPAPVAGRPVPATLVVRELAARGFEGGRAIVYRTAESPLETNRYRNLLWEQPPGVALAGLLADGLRAVDLFELVILPDQRARTQYLLEGELARFEHQPTEQPPQVTAEFSLTLVRTRDRSPLATRRYAGTEPVPNATPVAMAEAFNRLTGRLVGEAVRDLAGLRGRLREDAPQ
jgi:cholesterol transport system auxiliary component